jgi:RNA polymerase sigma-70 factor (ECF subfamily)
MAGETTREIAGQADQISRMEAIVAEHETALLRYATRIVNSPTLAQDVVQNVFIKLFKVWQTGMRPTDKLKGWLFRVTHNEAVDFVRRESQLRVVSEEQAKAMTAECADGVHCPSTVENKRELVLQNLRKLHPTEQQIILLRMQEGLSYSEMSEVTGRTEGNIGCILHNAVRKLAQLTAGPKPKKNRTTDYTDDTDKTQKSSLGPLSLSVKSVPSVVKSSRETMRAEI